MKLNTKSIKSNSKSFQIKKNKYPLFRMNNKNNNLIPKNKFGWILKHKYYSMGYILRYFMLQYGYLSCYIQSNFPYFGKYVLKNIKLNNKNIIRNDNKLSLMHTNMNQNQNIMKIDKKPLLVLKFNKIDYNNQYDWFQTIESHIIYSNNIKLTTKKEMSKT